MCWLRQWRNIIQIALKLINLDKFDDTSTNSAHIVVLRLFSIIRGYQRSSAIKSFLSTHSYKTLENAELKVLKVKFSTRRKRKTLRKMRLWHIQRLPRIRDYDMNNLHDIIPCAMPVKRASQEDYSLKPVFFIRWSEHVYFFTHQVFYVYFFGPQKKHWPFKW